MRAHVHAPPVYNPILLSPVSLPRPVGPRPTRSNPQPPFPERQFHSKVLPNAPHILPFSQSAPRAVAVPFQNVPRGPFRSVNPPGCTTSFTRPINPFAAHQPRLLGNPQPARLMRNPQLNRPAFTSQNQYPGSLPFRPTGPLPPQHEAYRGNLGRGRGYTLRRDPFGHQGGDSFRFGRGGQGAGRGGHGMSGRGGNWFRGPVRERAREPEVSVVVLLYSHNEVLLRSRFGSWVLRSLVRFAMKKLLLNPRGRIESKRRQFKVTSRVAYVSTFSTSAVNCVVYRVFRGLSQACSTDYLL
jgi:hypothetical protein